MRLLLFLSLPSLFFAQSKAADEGKFIREIYNEALSRGHAYENLRSLCKDVGARLSGSAQADMAVDWSYNLMNSYGFDAVYKMPVMVPHWERGNQEVAWIRTASGKLTKLHISALGGSIGTNGVLQGQLVYFDHLDDLKKLGADALKGKVAFVNQPMNEQEIATFRAYGGCYFLRNTAAIEAAKKGATAVIIRSLAIPQDDHPHTGGMRYEEGTTKIPAAALSTNDANSLAQRLKTEKLDLVIEMDCRELPDHPSFNVIAELQGTENKDEIITFGGHLDSWDIGEGAHDDGAGVIHCLEALRILKTLGYKPKHTLRVVFFMNEENGNMGGITYAKTVFDKGEKQIMAIESDSGGFSPRGFGCSGDSAHVAQLKSFAELLHPYELHVFREGGGGVDIGPLKDYYPNIATYNLSIDSQRYFDVHHAETDVFENVNRRELELGAAAMASLVYLLDQKN